MTYDVQGKALHQKAMQVALDHFGVAHATTTLARGNLVDALDQLGDRESARKLLTDSIGQIKEVGGCLRWCHYCMTCAVLHPWSAGGPIVAVGCLYDALCRHTQ